MVQKIGKGVSRHRDPPAAAEPHRHKKISENGKAHSVTGAATTKVGAVAKHSRKGGSKRLALGRGEDIIDKFKQRLAGGTFRMLNEQIYTTPSIVAAKLLSDKETYVQYHEGYRHQVSMWPVNPVEVVLTALKEDRRGRFVQHKSKHLAGRIPAGWVLADMGCGDAVIAQEMNKTNVVHSFDLCAANDLVTTCDIAHVPLPDAAVDVVIFSLSLMSTNFLDFIYEAHRILRVNKLLKIVEVRSRLPDPDRFAQLIESVGFRLDWWGVVEDYFCMFDLVRVEGEANREPFAPGFDPCSLLAPCLYKRR